MNIMTSWATPLERIDPDVAAEHERQERADRRRARKTIAMLMTMSATLAAPMTKATTR